MKDAENPELISDSIFDENTLDSVLKLRGVKEFEEFLTYLRTRCDGLAHRSTATPDDLHMKWMQGRVQELREIITAVEQAVNTKRLLQSARQRHPKGGAVL